MGGASLSACCPIRGGRPHTRASGSEGRQPLHCPHMRNVMGSAQWHPAAGSKRAREVAVPSRLMAVAAQTLNRGLRQQRRNAGCAMTPSSRIECDQKQSDAAAQEPRAAAARRRGRASCACAAPTCFASTGTARTRPRPPSTRTAGSGARSPLPLPSCSTRAACYMRGKRCCVDAQWEADMAACTEHALYPVVLSPFHRGLAAVTHRLAAVLHGLTATRRPKRTRVSVHCLARDPKHRGCDTAHCIHLCPGAQDRRHMRPGRRPALLAHPGPHERGHHKERRLQNQRAGHRKRAAGAPRGGRVRGRRPARRRTGRARRRSGRLQGRASERAPASRRQRPAPCAPAWRGHAWRYMARLCPSACSSCWQ